MAQFILQIIFVVISISLIATVLLQSGRAAGLGAIEGGAQTLFGKKKGLDEKLSHFTTGLAVAFMLLAIVLAVLS